MEAELAKLLNHYPDRMIAIREIHQRGKKVVGVVGSLVPVEIILAAGAVPWRIFPTTSPPDLAGSFRRASTNPYNLAVLESVLRHEFDFLDAVIIADMDLDTRRLWDAWISIPESPVAYLMYMPRTHYEPASSVFIGETKKAIGFLEARLGTEVTNASLARALHVYRRIGALIGEMYALRKLEFPTLNGTEFHMLTVAGLLKDPEDFLTSVERLMPHLQTRRSKIRRTRPRLLLSGDCVGDARFVQIVEEAGSVVAMDDLDTGSGYFLPRQEYSPDALQAMAENYVENSMCPRTYSRWEKQAQTLIEWVKAYHIDGVVELCLSFSMARHFRVPYLHSVLKKAGIPSISIDRDYHFGPEGQIRTRVEAFVEMLAGQAARYSGVEAIL